MICPKCFGTILAESVFCHLCGHKIPASRGGSSSSITRTPTQPKPIPAASSSPAAATPPRAIGSPSRPLPTLPSSSSSGSLPTSPSASVGSPSATKRALPTLPSGSSSSSLSSSPGSPGRTAPASPKPLTSSGSSSNLASSRPLTSSGGAASAASPTRSGSSSSLSSSPSAASSPRSLASTGGASSSSSSSSSSARTTLTSSGGASSSSSSSSSSFKPTTPSASSARTSSFGSAANAPRLAPNAISRGGAGGIKRGGHVPARGAVVTTKPVHVTAKLPTAAGKSPAASSAARGAGRGGAARGGGARGGAGGRAGPVSAGRGAAAASRGKAPVASGAPRSLYRQSVRQSFRQTVNLSSGQKAQIERAGWERAQKGTYTRWLNYHLQKKPEAGQVVDIEVDLCDGTKLCDLLEIFQGKKLSSRVWRPITLPKDRFKAVENASIFIKEFQTMYPTLKITVGPYDIVDGNYVMVMGMLWQMILAIQLDVNDFGPDSETRLTANTTSSTSSSSSSSSSAAKPRVRTIAFAKANLLEWVQNRVAPYGVEVTDFSDSFEDGKAFQALASSIDATYKYEYVVTNDPRHNLDSAFRHFEKLGVPQLLNVEDMVGDCTPDDRSVMTYLAMIQHAFKDAPMVSPTGGDDDDDDEESYKVTLDGPGLKQGYLGRHNPFSVTVVDTQKNRVVPSGEDIEIEVLDAMGANVLVFTQDPTPDGGSVYTYIPCRPDCELTMTIHLREALITTLTIPVLASPPDPSVNFKLKCDGIVSPVDFGLPAPFTIAGFPASLSPALVQQNLVSIVQGPGSQVVVSISDEPPASQLSRRHTMQIGGSKRYASWIPQEVGNHELFVFYAGQLQEEHFIDVVLSEVDNTPKAYDTYLPVGQPAVFIVTVKDPPDNIEFRVVDPNGNYIIPDVTKMGADQFKIEFIPTIAGEYTIETSVGFQKTRLEPFYAVMSEGLITSTILPPSTASVEPSSPARSSVRASMRNRSDSCVQFTTPSSSSAPKRYPVTGTETRPLPDVQTAPSIRVWVEDKRLETYLSMTHTFKTFPLLPTLTTEQLRSQMMDTITKGLPADRLKEAHNIASEEAYCLCQGTPDGNLDNRIRLYRTELVSDVIQRMKRNDEARFRAINMSGKLSPDEVDVVRHSFPCRLLVTVIQVDNPPTGSKESNFYFKSSFNHQVQKSTMLTSSSSTLKWNSETLPFGVPPVLPPDCQSLRLAFRERKQFMHEMCYVEIGLKDLPINHEIVGWFPLLSNDTGAPLFGRALLQVQYYSQGPWNTEAYERLYFCPAPICYLHISVWYPKQRMKMGQSLPIQVKVRDLQNNKELTDDLAGGELELHSKSPSGSLELVPVHKNYPNPEVGLFYIDFRPRELGTYQCMLKYNEQVLQHRICLVKVKPAKKGSRVSFA